MKYFKYSLIFRIWEFLCFCYENSQYHRAGSFFSKSSEKSRTHEVMRTYIEKTPYSANAKFASGTMAFFTTPFRFIRKYANQSMSHRVISQVSRQFNNHMIFSFLLILTTFSLGLNIADFVRTGTADILYSAVFVVSVLSLFIYMKAEKYIRHSLIYRLLDSVFDLKVEHE